MHSSPSFATPTQAPKIHLIISLLTVPLGQRSNGSWLAPHPRMGRIWSMGRPHNRSNKLGSGGSPIAVAPHSAQHQNISPESEPVRCAPSSPGDLSPGWGWGTAPPPHASSRKRGWGELTAAASPNKSPLQILYRCFLYPQSEEDFQELWTRCSDISFENAYFALSHTYFSHFCLVHLEALVKLSNSAAYDKNNALWGDARLW